MPTTKIFKNLTSKTKCSFEIHFVYSLSLRSNIFLFWMKGEMGRAMKEILKRWETYIKQADCTESYTCPFLRRKIHPSTPGFFNWNFTYNYAKTWSLFTMKFQSHCCMLIQKRIAVVLILHLFCFSKELFIYCTHGCMWLNKVIPFYCLKRTTAKNVCYFVA